MASYQGIKNDVRIKEVTRDQLLIDNTILCDCNNRHKNLGMEWVDYKKDYDMARYSYKHFHNILRFLDVLASFILSTNEMMRVE